MKKVILIIGSIVLILVTGFIILVNKLDADVEAILNETISELSLDQIEDGIYIGEYNEALAVKAKVEVTIVNHQITSIVLLEHTNGNGEPAEVILISIIEEQSILVDDIAGATYSSRTLKLAIMNAMQGE